mgnify:CR=1 FL=1
MSEWKEAGAFDGETWKPEKEGDTLEGLFVKQKSNVGKNNSNMYYIEVEGSEEPTAVWGSTVLDTKFEDIPIGALVRIEYLGKVEGKAPQPYKDFKVYFKEPSGEKDPFKH